MAGKRELIEPHKGDKRFVRRDAQGRFSEVDDVSRSLSQDRRRHAKTVSKPGYGDRGDRKRYFSFRRGVVSSSQEAAMRNTVITAMALALVCASASASSGSMTVLVGDTPAVEYRHDGPITIDARHTDAWSARKWVLDPWETTTISGWQVDEGNARRFFFTGEKNSYGAALGKTENLGVIEAVFYRERTRRREATIAPRAMPAPPPAAAGTAESSKSGALSDDYAATGMGERDRHEVESVDIDLDPHPVTTMRIRYEFRPQLVKLGVVLDPSPLERREQARGFGGFCPQP